MKLRTLALTPIALLALCQCDTVSGPVDSMNPTAEEQDALDMKWGLSARKNKGNVRRVVPNYDKMKAEQQDTEIIPKIGVQNNSSTGSSSSSGSGASSEAPTTVDPSVLQKLR